MFSVRRTQELNVFKKYIPRALLEKLYQIRERVFHPMSKHLQLVKKTAPRFIHSLLGVRISDETLFLVFDLFTSNMFRYTNMVLNQALHVYIREGYHNLALGSL